MCKRIEEGQETRTLPLCQPMVDAIIGTITDLLFFFFIVNVFNSSFTNLLIETGIKLKACKDTDYTTNLQNINNFLNSLIIAWFVWGV